MQKQLVAIAFFFFMFNIPLFNQVVTKAINGGNKNCFFEEPKYDDQSMYPKFNDNRMHSREGRQEIIQIATRDVFKYLGKVGDESWINRFVIHSCEGEIYQGLWEGRRSGKEQRIDNIIYYVQPNNWDIKNQLDLQINYVSIPNASNSAGSSQAEFYRDYSIFSRDSKYHYCGKDIVNDFTNYRGAHATKTIKYFQWDKVGYSPDYIGNSDDVNCNSCTICYRERLIAFINISFEVFDRQRLWIPTEGRWADTVFEAVAYLIAHELGHIECAISLNSNLNCNFYTKLTQREDDESSAWEFASSVLRYNY